MPTTNMEKKNLYIIFILIAAMIYDSVCAQEYPSFVPTKIKIFLQSNYPSWKLASNMNVFDDPVLKELGFDSTESRPNFVWGDFNGDSKRDYVLLLEKYETKNNKSQLSICFFQEKDDFKFIIVGESKYPGYLAEYIWISHKGSKLYNFETDEYFTLDKDGINFIVSEKGGLTYYFEKNKFISITTAD